MRKSPTLKISIPFKRSHEEMMDHGNHSPTCKSCGDCACFQDQIFLLTSWHPKTGKPICQSCQDDAEVLDFYEPFLCHCSYPMYQNCSKCLKSLQLMAEENPNLVTIPCALTSFVRMDALGKNRSDSFIDDFDIQRIEMI